MSVKASVLRLFVVSLLCATGAHAYCPLEVDPPSVVLRYGASVSINCSTTATQFEGMGWEATEGGTGLIKGVQHLIWRVDQVTMWTEEPECFITPSVNSNFNQCSNILDLTVYTFPDNIGLSDPGSDLQEGQTYNLTCHIPDIAPVEKLSVRWYKGDELIKTDTFNYYDKAPVNHTSVLSFTANRQDDGLAFRCEAHLDLRPDGPYLNASSQESRFTVIFGPEGDCFDNFLDELELLEGDTLEKRCPVAGNPLPTIKWLKDHRPFHSFAPMYRNDAGRYRYEAYGAKPFNGSLQILVLYPPHLICPATYTALEHTPHNLTCSVKGYPKPEVTWTKDGEDVWLPVNLTRSDTGQYTMRAFNKVSSVNATVEINVIYPPSQIVELEDSEVDVGSSVWLKCSSTGNPRPQYSWSYYQTANVLEENEDGVSRLHIQNATAYNAGSYTCHAWNDIGNVSKTVNVTVKGNPVSSKNPSNNCSMRMDPPSVVVRFGDSFTVNCSSSSDQLESVGLETMFGSTREYHQPFTTKTLNVTSWAVSPICFVNLKNNSQCEADLPVTIYKMPDQVSVSVPPSLAEGNDYQMGCAVTNVAPVRLLTVILHRGNELMFRSFTDNSKTPISVTAFFPVIARSDDDETPVWCEAKLDLGLADSTSVSSESQEMSVLYSPIFIRPDNETLELPSSDGSLVLNCSADGKPAPKYSWGFPHSIQHHEDQDSPVLVPKVQLPGTYRCTASNSQGSTSKFFTIVNPQRDRTTFAALLGGFVALGVVLLVAGYFLVTPQGTFSLNKGGYAQGTPTSS